VLFIGVDPSVRRSAVAVWDDTKSETTVKGHVVGPIERLGADRFVESLADGLPEVYVVIERPTWGGYGTRETRAAAIAWERHFQRLFPRRKVFFVDPRAWQAAVLHGVPGETTKDRAVWFCHIALRVETGGDHDLADAVCIAYYARRFHKADHAARQAASAKKKNRRKVS